MIIWIKCSFGTSAVCFINNTHTEREGTVNKGNANWLTHKHTHIRTLSDCHTVTKPQLLSLLSLVHLLLKGGRVIMEVKQISKKIKKQQLKKLKADWTI